MSAASTEAVGAAVTEAVAEAVAELAEADIRVTSQRVAILEAMGEDPVALTAAQVFARLRRRGSRIGLATVYRNLRILEDAGIVHSMTVGDEQAFSRCPGEHEHVRCHVCGRVVRLTGFAFLQRARRLLAEEGMELLDAHLELVGVCHTCRIPGTLTKEP